MTLPNPAELQPWLLLVLYGATLALVWRRSKFYRIFVAVLLGVLCLVWWGLSSQLPPLVGWLFVALQVLTASHFVRLVHARLRGVAQRALLTIPAHWFAASSFLAAPFAVAAAVGHPTDAFVLAYVVGALGVVQSLSSEPEVIRLLLDRADRGPLAPMSRAARTKSPSAIEYAGRPVPTHDRPLRVVQITDPHLGPFMSAAQLAAICQRAVDQDPDLVLVTGDLLTMESHGDIDAVATAFAPLAALPGRCFACHGNHDHEDRRTVREGLERAGVRLLVDAWARVSTAAGPVDVIGADYHWRDRTRKLHALFEDRPDDGTPRLLMLHHPGHIHAIPEGVTDLVVCGHTHGGHVGLLSLGLDWTVVRGFTSIPDHGLWVRGRDRIYVHRGTGHYGFPLRIGVPREESLLEIVVDADTTSVEPLD